VDSIIRDQRFLAIMLHLEIAGIDYPYSIGRRNGMQMEVVEKLIDQLLSMDLIQRGGSSSVKRSDDAFKKSSEVHKHHTYFTLTDLGEKVLREVKRKARIISREVGESEIREALKSRAMAYRLERQGVIVMLNGNKPVLTPLGRLVLWYSANGEQNGNKG